MQSPASKGALSLHRVATAADDPATFTDDSVAVNMIGFRFVTIQAIPINKDNPPANQSDWPAASVGLGSSDAAFDVWVWNPYVETFVQGVSWDSPGNGPGAGKPFQANIEVDEMSFVVLLRNAPTSGQAVAFFVSASHAIETL